MKARVITVLAVLGLMQSSDSPLARRLVERHAPEVAAAEQALLAAEASFGTEHAETARILKALGNLDLDRGRGREAAAYYERALAIEEKLLGKDHIGLSEVLARLAYVYAFQSPGNKVRAEALYRRAVAIAEKVHGPDHVEVGRRLFALARFNEHHRNYAQAREHYARRLAIVEKVFGPEHRSTAATLSALGTVSLRLENHLEAEMFLKRALAVLEKDDDLSYHAFTLEQLAEVYAAIGRTRESEQLRARAATMRRS